MVSISKPVLAAYIGSRPRTSTEAKSPVSPSSSPDTMRSKIIEVAIGGKPLSSTVEGRERHPIRVRYNRERRDDADALRRILVPIDRDPAPPPVRCGNLLVGPAVPSETDLGDVQTGLSQGPVGDSFRGRIP